MSHLPTSITGCQLWLDGSDASSLVLSGSNVTTWNDKSGNNYHMNSLTSSADWTGTATYPTIGTSINGLQTLNFAAQSALKQSTTLDGVKNLFWVGRIAAPTGSGGHPCYFLLGHDNNYDWHGVAYGGRFLDGTNAQGGILNASPTFLFTPDANAVTNATFRNVNMPSAPNVSILSVAGITGTTRYQGICYDRSTHIGWCGDLAEVIIYSTALTTEQRQTTEGYLAQKWGLTASLPAGHPGLTTTYYQLVVIPRRQKLVNVMRTVTTNTTYLPTSIAGCQMWLDGNDPLGTGTQPANGATVSTWVDKSVNGYNATAAPSRTAGTYSTSFRAVNFPNSTTGYITNYTAAPTNETMFVVFNNPTASYENNILIGGVQGARSLGAGYSGNGGNIIGVVGNLNTQVAWLARTDVGGIYTLGTTAIVTSQFTTSTNTISLNGGTAGSGGAPGFTAGRVTYLGVDASNGGFYYIGYAMEILFYNSILTTAQRQEVEGYLAQKWAITSSLAVGHPGLTTQVYQTTTTVTQPTTTTATYLPTSIAGCQLWLDGLDPAGTGVQPANGATVSTWVDKATAKNATATGSPTYLSGGGINFNASPYFVNQTLSMNLSQRSIFIVMQETSRNTGSGVIPFIPTPSSGSDYNTTGGLAIETANGLRFLGNYGPPPGSYLSALGNTNLLVKAIYNDTMNGTTGSGYLNGTNSTNVTADYTASNCSGYVLGGRWELGSVFGSSRLNGVIYEVIVFNTALNTTQRQEIESYLSQKWSLTASLPVGHPGLTTSVYQVTVVLPKQKLRVLPGISAITTTYSPSSIAGCQLWLDAADSASMTIAAGKVSQWSDKSGSNNHATSPSSIRDATLTANALNSRSVMTFSGSQNFTGPISIGTTFTQFILYFNSSGRIGQGLMDSNDAGILGKLAFQEGGSECFQSGFGFSYQRFFKTGATYRILMTKCSNPSSSATVSHWFNGTDQIISSGIWTFYGANSTPITSITIAARGDLIYFIGTIAEIIIYNSAISLNDQRQVEAYLAQKWGLTASLPAGHVGLTSSVYEVSVPLPKQRIQSRNPYNLATGGNTVTVSNGFKIHTFTTVGTQTFTLLSNGLYNQLQVLVVGGGGGGGGFYNGGGGGAGGAVYTNSFTLSPGAYVVTVGGGGSGQSGYASAGGSGSNSSFSSLTGNGGGGGGSDNNVNGVSGGCGGGMGPLGATSPGSGTQGYAGGYGTNGANMGNLGGAYGSGYGGGGGGGMGSVGSNALTSSGPGWGGLGLTYTIAGSNYLVCGGGGAGTADTNNTNFGLGGSSIGGVGGLNTARSATNGAANTGSGGGGFGRTGTGSAGGSGGSGIVVIAYSFI